MKEITEDYVSFEIAKLLKEKGFEQYKCPHSYSSKGVFKWSDNLNPYEYAAPSQAMVMKWLREVHRLYIDVGFGNDYKGEFLYMGDIYDLTKNVIYTKCKPIIEADDYLVDNPKNYEEDCEAAIKYCLEHLI